MDITLERVDRVNDLEKGQIIVPTVEDGASHPEYVIGRARDCNLRLNHAFVSRHHCELLINDTRHAVWVRDLGSQNGTFVNEVAVRDECELHNGDRLTVACVPFEVHIH